MATTSHGTSNLPKLKLEHLKLTSFSRMRVDLAAQVCLELTIMLAFGPLLIYLGVESECSKCLFILQ